ncbi:MAG: hypothetical protein OXF01_03340 [Gemmatimonadetes bacterium]|nr:hypothetical protein [Gemmatimonadota bacterium]
MSRANRKKKQARKPRKVRARLEVKVCGEEPEKAWNDLWVRILTEFTTAQTEADGASHADQANPATSTAVRDVDHGKMGRG